MIPYFEPKVKLFSSPSLIDEHFKNLQASGLSDETIKTAGFKTIEVPKWKAASAYVIPYPGVEGFSRLRLFGVLNGKDRYDQPKDTKCHLYVPPQVREILSDPSKPLIITEGEKKALKASQEGLSCIAVGGWWAWKIARTEDLISDFGHIALHGRKVILVPDNDFLNAPYRGINKNIEKGLRKLKKALEARGAVIEVRPIPAGDHKGFDDWLCNNPADEFWKLPVYELPLAGFKTSDLGNVERLIDRHGEDILWWHERGTWLVWNGVRWAEDNTEKAITEKAKETVRAIYVEASNADNEDRRKGIVAHAVKSEAKGRIDAMLGLAQRLLPITSDELNTSPWLLNVKNGVVNLHTGELLSHQRKNLMTKLAPVEYNPKAECLLWEKFLDRIMDNNKELIAFLQRSIGYALSGDTSEQCFWLLYGTGSNGKTVFINTVQALLGDYGAISEFKSFLAKENEGVRNDLAGIKGARFVSALEMKKAGRLDEGVIKNLTGGDPIKVRFLFREYFTYSPEFKIFLGTNHKPRIIDDSHGMWRRVKMVPFTVTIPKEEQIPRRVLEENLKAELSGILNWAIKGCLTWQKTGLVEPDMVRAVTEEYRFEQDVIVQFIDECTEKGVNHKVVKGALFGRYKTWAEDHKEYVMSHRALSVKMKELGYKDSKGDDREWYGLKLIEFF